MNKSCDKVNKNTFFIDFGGKMSSFQTYVEINLKNLKDNYNAIKKKTGVDVIPVVKADAYGHGANVVAKTLEREGVKIFAVSSVYEAMCLRESGIKSDILILGYVPDYHLSDVIENNITTAVYNLDYAFKLDKEAKRKGKRVKVHIKINSGMNRLGFKGEDEAVNAVKEIEKLDNIKIEGIFTHFATSDEENKEFSSRQKENYMQIVEEIEREGIKIPIKHIANSAAITDLDDTYLDAVRAGIVLYGIYPSEVESFQRKEYKPVMSLYSTISNIVHLKKGDFVSYGRRYEAEEDEDIAVICVGYADGYNRKLTNKGEVLINGKLRCKIAGTVCMDMCMVKLPKGHNVKIGDRAEMFGENILVEDLADICETIPYEILCLINKRVKRVYVE